MVAAVETYENKAAFAYRGELPWHGLGTQVTEGTSTTELAKQAHLTGWDVRLREIITDARAHKPEFEVLRTNPFDGGLDRLATVGSRYEVVQNEEVIAFADNIVAGGAKPETAGSIKNGTQVFMAFEIGDEIVLDPNGSADRIGRYLTVATSHDGTSAVYVNTSNVRVVCANTLTASKASAFSSFKVRHTQFVGDKMLAARTALGISFKQSSIFEQEMNALVQEEFTRREFEKLVEGVFPKPEKDARGSFAKWDAKYDTIMRIWAGKGEGGDTTSTLEDTKYKAYNVLNEHLLWYPSTRKGDSESVLAKASGFDPLTNNKNLDLFKVVQAA